MNKTTMIGIVAVAIIGIGITAVYAVTTIDGDLQITGEVTNAAINSELANVVTELQALTGAVQNVPGVQDTFLS